jgi:cytochrome c peroxidase
MRLTSLAALGIAAATSIACLGDLPGNEGRGSGSWPDGPSDGPPVGVPSPAGPSFGATVRQAEPPPPMSGGTLAVVPNRPLVVAADPDRDAVYVVDVAKRTVETVQLALHDEPGRVVIDGAMRAHVVLRSAGAIATIDLATATLVEKRAVCTIPRGIAWDEATDDLHVVCAGGELVTLAAAGGAPKRVVQVTRDLRDVVVTPRGLVVSTFRDADIIRLASDGSVQAQSDAYRASLNPHVAWRMIADPQASGSADPAADVIMAAQRTPRSDDDPPPMPASYYGGQMGCGAEGPLTLVAMQPYVYVPRAVLPVDLAMNGTTVALVAAGNAYMPSAEQIVFLERSGGSPCDSGRTIALSGAELTSIAYVPAMSSFFALSREPAQLHPIDAVSLRVGEHITLSAVSRKDTGFAVFHANSGAGVACASCHPEGRDDGHAWRSRALGARRTPSLAGTLAGTAPYHWNGEAPDLRAIMTLTFESRMQGPRLTSEQDDAIAGWLTALPALARAQVTAPLAVARGKAIFEGSSARCASCHAGAMRTNNASIDLGRGEAVQVPSLVGVAHRAPYFHDGSAPNLRAVLQVPHGGAHVGSDEIEDLVAFLESL